MANVEIVDVSTWKKNLIVEIPAEAAQQEYDRISREFAKHARIPGFRPGKTPLSLVKKRFQAEIRKQLTQELVPEYYQKSIQDRHLQPITEPLLDKVDYEEGGSFRFQASFEVLPPIHIENYRGLRSTVEAEPVTDEDVLKSLEAIQERNARFVPVEDRASRLQDHLTVNLKGVLADGSGIVFQDQNVIIHLGNADTLSGFTENLTGLVPGARKTFPVAYPTDFQNPRLAGKTVEYEAEVIAVKEKRLPEINDDLAKEAGDYASLQDLRESLRRNLEEAARKNLEQKVQDDLIQQVLTRNNVEVPDSLIDRELQYMLQRMAEDLEQHGLDVSRARVNWKRAADESRPRALERARRKLALSAIADQESLQVSDSEVDEEIRKMAQQVRRTADALRATLAKNEGLEELRQHLRRQKAIELICRQVG